MLHEGIAQYLGAQVDELAYSEAEGGNVFVDHMPTEPDRCAAVYTVPGGEADSKLPYDPAEFMVVIRSDADPRWALAVWQKVYNALHGLRHTQLPDGTALVYCLAISGSPDRLGKDDDGRPAWSTTFRTEILNPSAIRPAL